MVLKLTAPRISPLAHEAAELAAFDVGVTGS